MNLSKFSFCLGHEDPDVVRKGLDSFVDQVLQEHDAVDTFGYFGRSTYARETDDGSLLGKSTSPVSGLLRAYITTSTSCEELFTLWGVLGRDDDIELCVAHMRCFATILHCSSNKQPGFVDNIVTRLIHERGRSIQQQLNSSKISLIHSTMGLLIAMMASSQQNCKNVYQKFLAFNMPVLGNASQKGNLISWQHPHNAEVAVSTCGRHMTAIILELLVRTEDADIIHELLAVNSLLRKLSNAISRTGTDTILAILRLMFAFLDSAAVVAIVAESRNVLVDASLQETLLSLGDKEEEGDGKEVAAITHAFLLKYCRTISSSIMTAGIRGKRGLPGTSSAGAQMIRGLKGMLNEKHRNLEKELLSANPGLLAKALATLTGPWDPSAADTARLVATLSHAATLLDRVEIPSRIQGSVRALSSSYNSSTRDHSQQSRSAGTEGVGGGHNSNTRVAELADEMLRTVLPPSLPKRDLAKILASTNAPVQSAGLLFCVSALSRLQRSHKLAKVSCSHSHLVSSFEGALSASVQRSFPDLQDIVSIRTKLIKQLHVLDQQPPVGSEGGGGEEAGGRHKKKRRLNNTDNDKGGDGEAEGSSPMDLSHEEKEQEQEREIAGMMQHLISLTGCALECYMQVAPSAALHSKYDFVNLLHEAFTWPTTESCDEAAESFVSSAQHRRMVPALAQTLQLLRNATELRLCRWFGSAEEACKTINNVIVSGSWRSAVKRTVLGKVILLASVKNPALQELRTQAVGLLGVVLRQSTMFTGHGHVDYELQLELERWIASITCLNDGDAGDASSASTTVSGDSATHAAGVDAPLVLDVTIKFAYHFASPLCTRAAKIVAMAGRGKDRYYGDWTVKQQGALVSEQEEIILEDSAREIGAPWYLHSLGQARDGLAAGNFNGHALPFSPVVLAALCLSTADFSPMRDMLPAHIRSRLVELEGSKNDTKKGQSEARQFFDKYRVGFRRDLTQYVSSVLRQCAFGARNPASYSHLLGLCTASFHQAAGVLLPSEDETVYTFAGNSARAMFRRRTSTVDIYRREEANLRIDSRPDSAAPPAPVQVQPLSSGDDMLVKARNIVCALLLGCDDAVILDCVELVRKDVSREAVVALSVPHNSTLSAAVLGRLMEVLYCACFANFSAWPQIETLLRLCHTHIISIVRASRAHASVLTMIQAKLGILICPWTADLLTITHTCVEGCATAGGADANVGFQQNAYSKAIRSVLRGSAEEYLNNITFRTGRVHALWARVAKDLQEGLSNRVGAGVDASAGLTAIDRDAVVSLGWLLERVLSYDLHHSPGCSVLGQHLRRVGESDHSSLLVLRVEGSRNSAANTVSVRGLIMPIARLSQTHQSILLTADPEVLTKSTQAEAEASGHPPTAEETEKKTEAEGEVGHDGCVAMSVLTCVTLGVATPGASSFSASTGTSIAHYCDPLSLADVTIALTKPQFLSFLAREKGHSLSTLLDGTRCALPRLVPLLGGLRNFYSSPDRNDLSNPRAKAFALRKLLHLCSLPLTLSPAVLFAPIVSVSALHNIADSLGRSCEVDILENKNKGSGGGGGVWLAEILHAMFGIEDRSAEQMHVPTHTAFEKSLAALAAQAVTGIQWRRETHGANTGTGTATAPTLPSIVRSNIHILCLSVCPPASAVSSWLEGYTALLERLCREALQALKKEYFTKGSFGDDEDGDKEKGYSSGGVRGGETAYAVRYVSDLLLDPAFTSSISSDALTGLDCFPPCAARIRGALNKFTKGCLRHGLDRADAVQAVASVCVLLGGTHFNTPGAEGRHGGAAASHSWWVHTAAHATGEDFYHLHLLPRMLVSHSQYHTVLNSSMRRAGNSIGHLLGPLLQLVSAALAGASASANAGAWLSDGEVVLLMDSLLPHYCATLCDRDRAILRVLHLLHEAFPSVVPATGGLQLLPTPTNNPAGDKHIPQGMSREYSPEWVFQHLAVADIYLTLSRFPWWRSLIPQPLAWVEAAPALTAFTAKMAVARETVKKCKSASSTNGGGSHSHGEGEKDTSDLVGALGGHHDGGSDDDDDDDNEEDSERGSDNEESIVSTDGADMSTGEEEKEEEEEEEAGICPSVDSFACTAEAPPYDPAFWIQALHAAVYSSDLSARRLAHSGALSLTLASVGSLCPLVRSFALSILSRVMVLLLEQTPKKLPGFRERPQLLSLLRFVQNAISPAPAADSTRADGGAYLSSRGRGGRDSTSIDILARPIPTTLAIFLSRAALHTMQPSHELYSPVNKYLLSRPFMDCKDVPLFDLLVASGAGGKLSSSSVASLSGVSVAEQLACLRLLRDGIDGRADHLNLCRKNAYPRLLALVTLPNTDVRVVHIVFDILERLLSQPLAARYLVERCRIVAWLVQVGSPCGSLRHHSALSPSSALPAPATLVPSHQQQLWPQQQQRQVRDLSAGGLLSVPPRLLPRVLVLLRRALSAAFLVQEEAEAEGLVAAMAELRPFLSLVVDQVHVACSVSVSPSTAAPSSPPPGVSKEYLRQLILLLWDVAMLSRVGSASSAASSGTGAGDAGAKSSWYLSAIASLTRAAALAFSASPGAGADSRDRDRDRDELLLSCVALVAFNTTTGNGNVDAAISRDEGDGLRQRECTSALELLEVLMSSTIDMRLCEALPRQTGTAEQLSTTNTTTQPYQYVVVNRLPINYPNFARNDAADGGMGGGAAVYLNAAHLAVNARVAASTATTDSSTSYYQPLLSGGVEGGRGGGVWLWEQMQRMDLGATKLPFHVNKDAEDGGVYPKLALLLVATQRCVSNALIPPRRRHHHHTPSSSPPPLSLSRTLRGVTRWLLCLCKARGTMSARNALRPGKHSRNSGGFSSWHTYAHQSSWLATSLVAGITEEQSAVVAIAIRSTAVCAACHLASSVRAAAAETETEIEPNSGGVIDSVADRGTRALLRGALAQILNLPETALPTSQEDEKEKEKEEARTYHQTVVNENTTRTALLSLCTKKLGDGVEGVVEASSPLVRTVLLLCDAVIDIISLHVTIEDRSALDNTNSTKTAPQTQTQTQTQGQLQALLERARDALEDLSERVRELREAEGNGERDGIRAPMHIDNARKSVPTLSDGPLFVTSSVSTSSPPASSGGTKKGKKPGPSIPVDNTLTEEDRNQNNNVEMNLADLFC